MAEETKEGGFRFEQVLPDRRGMGCFEDRQRWQTEIVIQSTIAAPLEECFDLARSIDLTCTMTDTVSFESPVPVLGWLFDRLVLSQYLRRFLQAGNFVLKAKAELGREK